MYIFLIRAHMLYHGAQSSQNNVFLSQPNSTSAQVGSDKVISQTTTTHHHPVKLLRHFQTTQEADFRYATLFWPNYKDDLKKKMEDYLKKKWKTT